MLNGTTTGLGSTGQAFGAGAAPHGGAHLIQADGSGSVTIPGNGTLLSEGDYSRSGTDLVIHGPQGQDVIVRDYFATDHPPKLITASGASLDGSVVTRLAGPQAAGQTAQAGSGQTDAGNELIGIGKVKSLKGEVTVKHPDGTTSVLKEGDVIYQDDVIETGADSAVGLVLADKSTFSLGAKGRMVLDEMIYDPNAGDGKSAIAVLSGTFSFVSGQIAKANPDGMQIKTPVATLGIRGTTGHGSVEGENTAIALVADPDGQVGEIIVTNGAGISVLNQPLMMSTITGAFQPPSPPVFVPASSLSSLFGDAISSLPNPTTLTPRDLPPAATQGTGPQPSQQQQQDNNPNTPVDPTQQGQNNTSPVPQGQQAQGPSDGQASPPPPVTVTGNSSLSTALNPNPSLDKLLDTVIGSKDPVVNPAQSTGKSTQTGSSSPTQTSPTPTQTSSSNNGYQPSNPNKATTPETDNSQTGNSGNNGNGGGSNAPDTPTSTVRSGTMVDPYVSGATVWLDSNNNGKMDSGEWNTTSGPAGYFELTDSSGGSLNGVLRTSGGVDSGSGATINWSMAAPSGAKVITPLTTLVQILIQSGQSASQAQANVQSALGLNSTTDILTTDPLGQLNSNPTDAQADTMLRAGIAVANLISVGVAALIASGATSAAAQAAMLDAVGTLTSGGGSDVLTDALITSGTLTSLLNSAASSAGVPLNPSFSSDLAAALESINAYAMNPANSVVDAAKAGSVAQSDLVSTIGGLGSNPGTLGPALDNYTTNLSTSLSNVNIGQMTPTQAGTDGDDVFVAAGIGGAAYYGRAGNDTITGTAYKDRLYGEDGNDTINGGGGDDTIDGGDGDDLLDGGAGNDIINGGNGNDTLTGGAGNDTFNGGAGNDIIHADGGNDTVVFDGSAYGNDTIYVSGGGSLSLNYSSGGPAVTDITTWEDGDTYLRISYADGRYTQINNLSGVGQISGIYDGSTGNTYTVGTTDASGIVLGSIWEDTINLSEPGRLTFAGDGNDTVNGSGGADEIYGGFGDDLLNGGTGNDILIGGYGNDTLDGGADDDTLTGGVGNDIFILSTGHDVIKDFTAGQDKVDMRTYLERFIGEGIGQDITSFTALKAMMSQSGSDTVITLPDSSGGMHTLTLKGVNKDTLTADDFLMSAPTIPGQTGVIDSNIAVKGLSINSGTEVLVTLSGDIEATTIALNVGTSGVTVEFLDNRSLKIYGTTEQINAALAQTESTGIVIRGVSGSGGYISLTANGVTTSGSIALMNGDISYYIGDNDGEAALAANWDKIPGSATSAYFSNRTAILGADKTLTVDTANVTESGGLTINGKLISYGDGSVDSTSALTINGGGVFWGYGTTTVSGSLHLNSTIDSITPANTKLGSISGVSNIVRMTGEDFSIASQFNLQGQLELGGMVSADFSGTTLTGGGVIRLDGSMVDASVDTDDASFDGTLEVFAGDFNIYEGRTYSVGNATIGNSGYFPGRIQISSGGTLTLTEGELLNSGILRTTGGGTAVINAKQGYNDTSNSLIDAGAVSTILDYGTGNVTLEGVITVNSNSTLTLKGNNFALSPGDSELSPGRVTGNGTLDGSLLNSFVLSGIIRPGDYVNTEAFPSIVNGIGTLGLKGDAWFTEDTVVIARAGSTGADGLTFDGGLHLAGTLQMTFTSAPISPISFISATPNGLTDTLSGTFNRLDFRGIGSGLLIDPAYNTTTKTLTLTAITTGITTTTVGGAVADYVWNDEGNGDFSISGADVVYGNAGDDIFRISTSDTSFHLLDGGEGVDTLKINAGGTTIDLSGLIGRVQAMDVIDISDTNAGKLTILDAATVRSFNAGVDITDGTPVHSNYNPISGQHNALFITGDGDDTLHMKDPSSWVSRGTTAYTVNGSVQTFRHYTADDGDTHLYVAEDVTVDNLTQSSTPYSIDLPDTLTMVAGGSLSLPVTTTGLSGAAANQMFSLTLSVSAGSLFLLDGREQRSVSSGDSLTLTGKNPDQIQAILDSLSYHDSDVVPTRSVIVTLTDPDGVSTFSYTTITTGISTTHYWLDTTGGDAYSYDDPNNWNGSDIGLLDRLEVNSGAADGGLGSGKSLTIDSLQVNGSGSAGDHRLTLEGHLTVNGTGNSSSFSGEMLELNGGELTVNGNGLNGFTLMKGLVSGTTSALSGVGHLTVTTSLTFQNATAQSSLHLLEISGSTGADLYLQDSTLSLQGSSLLAVGADSGNDLLDGTLQVTGSSVLNIGAEAAAVIAGHLVLADSATLSVTGAGALAFSAGSGPADVLLGNGSTLDVTGYNTAHNGGALVITDALIRPGSSAGDMVTLRGDYIFGHNSTLLFTVEDNSGTASNMLTVDGDATFAGANLSLSLNSGLPNSGVLTLIDATGTLSPLWNDIHYTGVDATQIFRPYIDGNDLKAEIITSGITTGNLADSADANYVYAESGADVFYVRGADVVFGNDGNDLFYVRDHDSATGRPAFSFLDGGSGTNELLIDGGATSYNLDQYAPWIQNFDVISFLNDNSNDSAFISADAVRSILGDKTTSDMAGIENALIIKGETGDHLSLVSATGAGWAADNSVPEISGYTGYTSTNSAGDEVHLYVQNNISVHQTVAA